MKLPFILLWALLSILGAVALAHVTGVINPHEKVNGLWLVVAAACIYVLAYRFYGRWLARKVVQLDDKRLTPAVRLNDGVNFHPTNKVVLFGHHFAAIAGAGPLLGPVLAAQFGFLPGFLWLVIGAVLAGAVQDFIILVASMRRNGRSLPEIAHDELGSITGTATAIAVLFIVVVALAGLGFAVVNALYHNAWGTFTIAMTIPIGFIMGFYLQKFRPGAVAEVSVIGVVLLVAAVLFGRVVGQSSFAWLFEFDKPTLVWLLAGYGFLASVLPGWMLLVPRGYLSTFMKLGVVFLLGFGVILMAPTIEMPRVTIVRQWRRADYSRHAVSLSLHYDCLRRCVGFPFPGVIGHDAEDDRAGVAGSCGLCGDVAGKFCRRDGVDCGLGADPRRLSGDQHHAIG